MQHDEEAGDLRFGFTYDWEIVRGSDYASITWQMQDDGSSGATVTFNDYTGDDFLNEEVVVRVTATKDGMSATSNDLYLFVSNEYPEVWIQETDSINIVDLLLGDSRQVTPEVRYFKQAGDEAYEACELESVRWDFDEDCVNITDAGGNLVASGDECEPGTFTITRLGDWDSDIDLEASWRPTADQQPDVADSEGLRHEHTRFHLDHYDADLFFEGDIPNEFFVRDDTDSLTLTVNRQNVSDLAYLDWTVGLCVEDDWVEEHIFTEGVEYTAQGNTITLNGPEILDHMGGYGEGEEYVHVRVFVEAKLPDSSMPNPVIANATTWVDFREPYEVYNLPWNRDMIVGWEDTVFRWYDGQIRNEEHPGGDRVNCEVTDVAVLGENPDEGYSKVLEVRREEWEDDEGTPDHNWRYRAVGHGLATVQVTYVTQSGETRTHEFNVSVSSDLYDLRVWSGDWADCVLPGTTVDLYAEAVHHREGQEDTTEGLSVDWRLIEGWEVGELTIDPNDPNHAIFTVSTDKLHYDDCVNVRAYLYDGISGPMAENSWMFQVRDEYLELWPTHIDENLALGAEQDIDVELRHYSWGNFTNGYEVVEGARYELAEIDPSQVIIADAAGNYLSDGEIQPGTYTVMRQGRNDTSFTLRCWYNDDNNHTQYFDHWYDLHGRNYNLWFENVPDRVVVDDEHPTTTLALNTQDFEGVQDVVYNITVGTWENDQWVDILQPGTDYAVEDNEIILNSASILERFDTHEMRLRATAEATWQGQQLHETDCWFTLLEPYAEYWKQEDRDVLPGWDGSIDDFGRAWVCDAEHPDGYDALYEVTDVQVIAGEEHLEDFHQDSNEYGSWWYYRAKDFGTVTFEVTYR
ncbi:MAG: hypothetical protein Q4D48_09545, partial [Coriobacteriales bacterium]|nr:hypothetical protein [Coriobacteriales bacterium]